MLLGGDGRAARDGPGSKPGNGRVRRAFFSDDARFEAGFAELDGPVFETARREGFELATAGEPRLHGLREHRKLKLCFPVSEPESSTGSHWRHGDVSSVDIAEASQGFLGCGG